jgi:aminoglycoside phosphotransferase
MLRWINERIKTPKPVFYQRNDNTEYLLTTEIKGKPTYQVEPSERKKTVKILAKTLRKIHNLDVEECPFDRSLSNKIVLIENKQLNADQKYKLDFIKNIKLDENPVFTHGDYCLPNIIINGNRLSGVIDWDYAGLADPYVDFVLVTWSLKYNYGEIESKTKWIPLFFKEYEIHVNQEKMKYYQILNELFS